jgi:2-C-methyl-D-erythritol 4-phosphate cytidylyltransferase
MANLASKKSRRPGVNVWTIVVAGGSGRRFGALKQYAELGGRRVVDLAVENARAASDGVILVVPVEDAEREGGVAGGPTRTASVRNGLAAVPDDADVILVHDAARPFASPALFAAVVDAVCAGADGAVPGLPVTDTVKVIEFVPRSFVRPIDRSSTRLTIPSWSSRWEVPSSSWRVRSTIARSPIPTISSGLAISWPADRRIETSHEWS